MIGLSWIIKHPWTSGWYCFSVIAIGSISVFTNHGEGAAGSSFPHPEKTPIALPTQPYTFTPTPSPTHIPSPTPRVTFTTIIKPTPVITTILPTPMVTSTIIIPPSTPPPSISATPTPSSSPSSSPTRTPKNHANGLVCFVLDIKDKNILIKVPCKEIP
jgi:hypothetical protein